MRSPSASSRPAWGWLSAVLVCPIGLLVLIETLALSDGWRAGFEFGAAVLAIAAIVAWVRANGRALTARETFPR